MGITHIEPFTQGELGVQGPLDQFSLLLALESNFLANSDLVSASLGNLPHVQNITRDGGFGCVSSP